MMSHFIRRLLLFLLPVILLGVGAESFLRSFPNSYRVKASAMNLMADSVESIILGNSHAYYAVRPALLSDAAVNLANVSQTLAIDREILETYAPRCSRLKTVYLVCDHSNLFDPPLDHGDESFRLTYYHLYMNLCRPAWTKPFDWELWHTASAVEKLKNRIGAREQATADCDSLGWGTAFAEARRDTANLSQSMAQRRAEKHTCRDGSLAEANCREVRHIAAYCRDHHLRLILFATPVTAAYLQHIPASQRAYVNELLHSVQLDFGAVIVDDSTNPRFSDDDFFDADHLSDAGAAKFTQLFKKIFV